MRITSAFLVVMLCACGPTVNEPGNDDVDIEAEPDLHSNELEQGLIECSRRSDTGYRSGSAFAITVVSVDGRPAEVETADAYFVMQQAAEGDGVHIRVVSGFRTNDEQRRLYACYTECNCNSCNLAARPGYSNHQSGHALDLNTSSTGVLDWLNRNGARFGFRRTVPSETWHWEWWGGGPGGGPCGQHADVESPSSSGTRVAMTGIAPTQGYWIAASDGAVYSLGDAQYSGGANSAPLAQPIVGMTSSPSGHGYWLVASDGGVFAFGDAGFFGSMGGTQLNKPVVGMASTPSGNGYWLVASDGGIFAFGDAGFFGSTGSMALNAPIVGMAATATGNGYWLVASDGGIFAFGDAGFFGSMGGTALNQPVVGMARSKSGSGYWLVARDGGIFAFGDAGFFGSAGGIRLNQPIVGMASTPSGKGYWLVAGDGGIFSFGDAKYLGNAIEP